MEIITEFFAILGIGGSSAFIACILFLVMQIIGEICEKFGKIVPEFVKVRKFFKRKKLEKAQKDQLLVDTKKALDEFNKHYSTDNINQRNEWITSVNNDRTWMHERADVYDQSIKDLKDDFKATKKTLEYLYIQNCRTTILDFSTRVCKPDYLTTKDEFRRIFKVHEDYEKFLKSIGEKNGEINDAMEVIHAEYRECLRENKFLEPRKY